ncbi:Domain of unknown function / Thioredoxin [hydrothermal vent metagenome]|uniref:Thioredoxin domain-containing protein n=1 Tax=hydrothermal vent metagenome TaxID=652676 RepID=A0A3B1DC24_9ZZZZ
MTLTSVLLFSTLLGAQPQGEVIDFSATWCGPCQEMAPIVSRLKRQGYAIRKVDIDQNTSLANKYRVTSLPTFVLVVRGKEVRRVEGKVSEGQLKRMLLQIPTTPIAKRKSPFSGARISIPSLRRKRSVPQSSDIRLVDDKKTKTRFQFPFSSPFSKKSKPRERTIDSPRSSSGSSYARNRQRQQTETSLVRVSPSAASCRLQVKDKTGINFGSGTIIASQPGKTIILTCGHIFRDLNNETRIQVDIFEKGRIKKYLGTVIRYDKESDVGLLSIASRETFPIARIARIGESVSKSDLVTSIGCNGGKAPTRQQLRVTALNRYLGPDNIECTGVPVQGRSGGGLFNRKGHVVGVCFAADKKDKRGLYAGTKAIHQLLEESQLATLYRTKDEAAFAFAKTDTRITPRLEPTHNGQAKIKSLGETSAESSFEHSESAGSQSLTEDQQELMQAALKEAGEADVICIVRPPKNSNKKSRIIIIHNASDKFKKYLSDDERSQYSSRRRSEQPVDRSSPQHSHEEDSSSFSRDQFTPTTSSKTSGKRLLQTTARETKSRNGLQRYRRNHAIR